MQTVHAYDLRLFVYGISWYTKRLQGPGTEGLL
jgi:hypothetical protein